MVVAFALFQRLSDPLDPINEARSDEEPVLDPERIDAQEIRDTVSNLNFLAKTVKSASAVFPESPRTNPYDNPFDPPSQ